MKLDGRQEFTSRAWISGFDERQGTILYANYIDCWMMNKFYLTVWSWLLLSMHQGGTMQMCASMGQRKSCNIQCLCKWIRGTIVLKPFCVCCSNRVKYLYACHGFPWFAMIRGVTIPNKHPEDSNLLLCWVQKVDVKEWCLCSDVWLTLPRPGPYEENSYYLKTWFSVTGIFEIVWLCI